MAESNSIFSLISGNEIREAAELHSLVPRLTVTDDKSSIIALQITFFPFQGFCIGITAHHKILDGKSSTMFIKSWAYLCKLQGSLELTNPCNLPPELTPFYDRSVIKDPIGLDLLYLNQWLDFTNRGRSLSIIQSTRDDHVVPDDLVHATFDLTREDIKKLKEKANKPLHNLSSFVVTLAYYGLV